VEHETQSSEPVVTNRTMEIVAALFFATVAVIVMADSLRVGAGWAPDGPRAGYFPFYVGLVMLVSSLSTLGIAVFRRAGDKSTFVERDQFALVMQVFVPSMVFVVAVGFIGIYVAATLFIAFFMHWVGRYPARTILPVAVLVPMALFVAFEIWFLVPLPKGPLEAMLGY